ncbi:hypothetical protein [Cryptosporangium minutisporangium]|uniref:Protein kinase domain-containing protein n=1 Tax=Cryptosporangium minutisporangium TaxID=113569 RepID=A0ABP6TCN5_9ACTN
MSAAPDLQTAPWYRVHLPVGGWALPVDVAPPDNRQSVVRKYPIPADGEHDAQLISAHVLYTRGLTAEALPAQVGRAGLRGERAQLPFKNWFVKAYWCATPVEAHWLMRHFKQQSSDVLDANTTLNGTALRPPWAVAPVWVVPALTHQSVQQVATTHLGADAEGIFETSDARLWSWFGRDDNPQPENCFLVLTRYLPEPMPFIEAGAVPRTDRLQELEAVARGIDACHQAGIAHCDIKPDNVRSYSVGAVESFVLIDADAVLRLDSRPQDIRLTLPYTHPELAAAIRACRPITPEVLKAHDRYGFALVALGAVAGTATADAVIGRAARDPSPITGDEIRVMLRSAWGTEWDGVIDPLVQPFDEPFDEYGNWSAEQWISDVLNGQTTPGTPSLATGPPPPPVDTAQIQAQRAGIDEVRRALPAALIPPDAPDAVVDATVLVGSEIARRQFRAARWPWLVGLPVFALLLVVTILRELVS